MTRLTVVAVLSEHRRALTSLVVTVMLLGSLAAATVPSSALETELTGPDEVDRNARMTVTATVDIEEGERVPIETYQFTISPEATDSGEALTVTFAPNGTIHEVTPEDGTINNGDIRIQQFVESLTITPVENQAPYGYGTLSAYDEEADVTRDYGYGYGYGYGDADATEFEYRISFNATALDRGTFVGRLGIDTGDESAFVSDEFEFEVTKPTEKAEKGHKNGEGTEKNSHAGQNRQSGKHVANSDTSPPGRSAIATPVVANWFDGGDVR
ncbi:hypothetical protein [Haloferax sp. DFSO52]|uniref:hypothetical protein n=1 Tax=Haloferax sp. DFSO52 TaxID=3388505 RepID=UPI003A839BA5